MVHSCLEVKCVLFQVHILLSDLGAQYYLSFPDKLVKNQTSSRSVCVSGVDFTMDISHLIFLISSMKFAIPEEVNKAVEFDPCWWTVCVQECLEWSITINIAEWSTVSRTIQMSKRGGVQQVCLRGLVYFRRLNFKELASFSVVVQNLGPVQTRKIVYMLI